MEQQPDCDFKVGGYEDAAHLKSCSLGVQKCARCKWATYKVKWQKDLPWLDAKMNLDSGLWGIGCRLCHDAQQVAPEVMSKFPVSRHHFARYEVSTGEIRVTRFRKHAESPAHRTAESMAGGKEPALDDIGGFTPSTAEWKSVINHTKPSNLQADVSDVANRKKAHMMRWCLAEAHREHQREAVKNALCLSLSQDQRGRRLRDNTDLCRELAEVLQLQDCNFQLLNRAGLDEAIAKLNPARARQLIVLRSDAGDEAFDQVRLQFTGLTEAVEHWVFCTEDKSRSRSGIAESY